MRGLVLGAATLAACSSSTLPSDLGEHLLDGTRLVDAPALVHLAAALDDADDLTVEDLFREHPAYARAPDPAQLLDEMQAEHVALPELPVSVPLRVLSFNTGLLDRWYPFAVVQVPHVDERRAALPADLLGEGYDVLLLQEVWDTRDVRAFEAEAAHRGYRVHAGSSDAAHEAHGLLMLVREDLIDPAGPDERDEETFELQRDIEQFPGPGVERGMLSWRLRHAPSGLVLTLIDTHTTAFPELSWVREAQARQLGLRVRDVPEDDVVVLTGDLNAGPYYPHDRFGEVDGEPVVGWWRNAQAYPLLLHYGDLWDAHAAAGQAQDVALLDALPAFGPAYRREPYGDASQCNVLVGVFTATDCNTLYFEQYAATEYPARLDHVMVRDALERVRVRDSAVVYTDPLAGETFERSDHYGVAVTLLLASG